METQERKKAVIISDEDREKVFEMAKNGATNREIAEVFGIHPTTVSKMIKRNNAPNTTKKVGGRERIVLPDNFADIYNRYKSSEIRAKDAIEELGVNNGKFYRMITVYESTNAVKSVEKEEVKESNKSDETIDATIADIISRKGGTVNRKMRRQAIKNSKKSKNRHQRKQDYKKYEENIKAIVEEVEAVETTTEVATTTTNELQCLELGNVVFPIDDFGLIPITIPDIVVKVGLVADRHKIPVDRYIFEEELDSELMFDFDRQLEIASKFVLDNVKHGQVLHVYCTGMQCALGAITKACLDNKVNLVLKHYNASTKSYRSQVVVDLFGDIEASNEAFAFTNLIKSGAVYGYNCTCEDLIKNKDAHCISVNKHGYKDSFEQSTYILCLNDGSAWSLYPKLIESIHNDSNETINLSVLMAEMEVYPTHTVWGTNLSKGYNFK